LCLYAVKSRLDVLLSIDDQEAFQNLMKTQVSYYNVTFSDVMTYLLTFRPEALRQNLSVEVPYACIGYLLFGCNLKKLRCRLSLEQFASLVATTVLRRSGANFDVSDSVPTEYGFVNVNELYNDARSRYLGRRDDVGMCACDSY